MSGFSFSFAKTAERKVLQDSGIRDESTKDRKDDVDYVKSLNDKHINSTVKKEQKKDLVIPLIVKNHWRTNTKVTEKDSNGESKPETTPVADEKELTPQEEAARELIAESRKELEAWENRSEGDVKKIDEVPLVLNNAPPAGFETDDALDVSCRAEQSTMDDYENVPIEQYGLAMLRGMGWKKDQGIGGFKKQVIESIDPVVRPKGLGLGAAPKKVENKEGKSKEEEELKLKRGAFILIDNGSKKGQYGEVEGLDEENGRVVVKLALGNAVTSVSENIIKLVTKTEFKEKGKVVNLDKYEKYKKDQDEKKEREEENRRRSRSRSREKNGRDKYSRRSRSNSVEYIPEKKKRKEEKVHKKERTWVRPQLRVRCIDSKMKDGKYYKSKMVVVDVVTNDSCDCQTEDGRLVQGVRTDRLETVIPKRTGDVVMVVGGTDRGQLGEVLDRDKHKSRVTVRLLQNQEIDKFDYDNVCEYAGEVTEDYN